VQVSVKGVLLEGAQIVLLENERGEWELPGGRPEPGETFEVCLIREMAEELGIEIAVERWLDSWIYEVLPDRFVEIVTYGVRRLDCAPLCLSAEHSRLGRFTLEELASLRLPEGYRQSIYRWVHPLPRNGGEGRGEGVAH
jgi:8-oxo-dGTP pyrophosphatase MutT (NUDIX family)